VDDPVADGVRGREGLDRAGFVPVYEVKLEARGACVDDKNVHGRGFS
jgi:hypothetical protein